MKTVVTHDGGFHSDEVFAIAILKLIYPDLEVIRTRDEGEIEKADIVVDVGRVFDVEKNRFDHHQNEFQEKRKSGSPYASAGLIWKYFGDKLVNSTEAHSRIDKMMIEEIDCSDNGLKEMIDPYPYVIGMAVKAFYPNWNEENKDYDEAFERAVNFAKNVLTREISFANTLKEGYDIVRKAVADTDKEYIVLDPPTPPWTEILVKDFPNIKFVIYKYSGDLWAAKGVPLEFGGFEPRIEFPESWLGLSDKDLEKETGVEDVVFCHKANFFISGKTKEAVIEVVEKTLELAK